MIYADVKESGELKGWYDSEYNSEIPLGVIEVSKEAYQNALNKDHDAVTSGGVTYLLGTAFVPTTFSVLVLRKNAYNALNQFEMQFDDAANGTTTWLDAINTIKQEFPK